jgi:predicted alpha/beta hydrolase
MEEPPLDARPGSTRADRPVNDSASDVEEALVYAASDGVTTRMGVFPAREASAPVLVCLPAMGVRASYYTPFARALSASGMHAVTSDMRGLGTSSLRPSRACDFGYEEMLTRDLPALLQRVRERFPGSPVHLLGHSLGGQLAMLHMAANPGVAAGLILVAACNLHYKGWPAPKRYGVLGFALLLRAIGDVLGYVPAGRLGFAGTEARGVVIDWSNNCRTGNYTVKGSPTDYEHLLQQMAARVLCISFAADQLVPPRAVENLLHKLQRSKTTHCHFRSDHPGLESIGHFDWVKRPAVLVETIARWVTSA